MAVELYFESQPTAHEFDVDTVRQAIVNRCEVYQCLEANLRQYSKNQMQPKYLIEIIQILGSSDIFAERNQDADLISHCILRMSSIQDKYIQNKFILYEKIILSARLQSLVQSIDKSDSYQTITNIEFALFNMNFPEYDLSDIIKNDLNGRAPIPFFDKQTIIHKPEMIRKYFPYTIVPFHLTPNRLISIRLLYTRNGLCFIPNYLRADVLLNKYEKLLQNKMESIKVKFNAIDETANSDMNKIRDLILHSFRIMEQLSNDTLSHHLQRMLPSAKFGSMIHTMPLCITQIILQTKQKQSINYQSRLQLIGFAKECGFQMNDFVQWLQKHLQMDKSGYDEKYKHFIETTYQKLHGYSCSKMISCGACPFDVSVQIKELAKKCNNVVILNNALLEGFVTPQSKCKQLCSQIGKIGDIEDFYTPQQCFHSIVSKLV